MQNSADRKAKEDSYTGSFSKKIDDLIGVFSPQRKFDRMRARWGINYAFSNFHGSERTRLRTKWVPSSGSADDVLLGELSTLRERCRDLNRNDSVAKGITDTIVNNVVGSGIVPQSTINYKILGISKQKAIDWENRIEDVWRKWEEHADITGLLNFCETQKLYYRQKLDNGDSIALPRMLKRMESPYEFALEIIEADRLSTPYGLKGNGYLREGVEIDDWGRPITYYIQTNHPGSSIYKKSVKQDWIPISAYSELGQKNVYHYFDVLRAGQNRGIPLFVAAILAFQDLGSYIEAELVAKRIAACYGIFFRKKDPWNASRNLKNDTNSASQRITEFEPGMVGYLGEGEEVFDFKPNRPGEQFRDFVELMHRIVGTSANLPYELVLKDFSKTNYSSARAALLEARRYFKVEQKSLIRKYCQPTYERVIDEAYLKDELDIPDYWKGRYYWTKSRWITPGWQWVDPKKEIEAAILAIKNNLSTHSDETASQGREWETVFEQKHRELEKKRELGLPEEQEKSPAQRFVDSIKESIIDEVLEIVRNGKE